MTRPGLFALAVPVIVAGAAIGHAVGDAPPGGPAVVAVEGRGTLTATGFVVAPDRVVTVAHAVGDRVTVRGDDGVARPAALLRRDPGLDLALLRVPGVRPAAPSAGAARVVVPPDRARGARPPGLRRRVDARVRTAAGRVIGRRPALELHAAVEPGDSGAPVVADGRIAGVVFAVSRDRENLAYAVDAAALPRLLAP
jgi:S1-C subfamily serine protease